MKSKLTDSSAGVSGPNLKLELAGNHSMHSAKRSEHYHSKVVSVGKTDRGPTKMTKRVGKGGYDNMEDTDGKL